MRRTTESFKAKAGGQVGSRIGILLGALALLCSAPLLGGDEHVTADGQNRQVANPPRHVLVISIPDRKLALTQDGRVLKVYPVAVGAVASPSPTGTLKIINKVENPTYFHRGNVIAPGKSNPLGDRWMGLSEKGYGIHGTNVPSSIGQAASHGCIRMRKHDVEDLFNLVRVGDVVEIHSDRDQQVAETFADWRLAIGDCRLKENPAVPGLQSAIDNHQLSISQMVALAEGN